MSLFMNPIDAETIPLAQACLTCLTLEATTDWQHHLQEQCAMAMDFMAGLEMLLDTEAEDYPAEEL